MKFEIKVREFGRGKPSTKKFSTLEKAAEYIKEYWQGPDYIDGEHGFHTDYCNYELIGFKLSDIGRFHITDDYRDFTFSNGEVKPLSLQELLDKGRYVLLLDGPRYCPSTDALIGSTTKIIGDYNTREEAEKALAEQEQDPDLYYRIRPEKPKPPVVYNNDELPF